MFNTFGPKITVPFTVSSASILTLNTVPVAIATFGGDDRIRVPARLEINKPASSTAYAITYVQPYADPTSRGVAPTLDENGNYTREYYKTTFGGGAYLIIRDDYGHPFFWIPADALLQTTARSSFVCLPSLDGQAFQPGRNVFYMTSGVPIATGTGTLNGTLFFEEYPA